jgi:peptidoglycan-associated lipoprotein
MSALTKTTPFLLAAMLIAGATACRKPAPAPQPAPAKPQAAAPAPTADDAARKSADEQKRKADEAAEAARKAAAAQEAAYHQAAAAALKDVHFAFDKSDLMAADKPILAAIADFMKAYPQARLLIDGNCDERGTVEYNLGLGERRGHAALAYLVGLGVDAKRLSSTSYGKEKPVCTEATESCWGRNRRAHFTLQ